MERLLKVFVLITCFAFVCLHFVFGVCVSVCDFSACLEGLEPAMGIFIGVCLVVFYDDQKQGFF